MTPTQVLGALLIMVIGPLLGGLPLIRWLTYGLTRKDLAHLGTGNLSVSAAFYHGGTVAGVMAVLLEAGKGIGVVWLARSYFPTDPAWEVIALIALVMGRYWGGRGAGTTNVTWGYLVHDWLASGLVLLLSLISFTIFREKRQGRLVVLVLLPIFAALLHPTQGDRVVATLILSVLMAWIYHKMPDDLDLSTGQAQPGSKTMFRFFRGDRAVPTLDQAKDAKKVGAKVATLAQLTAWGYPVPMGWVLPPGDDPSPMIEMLNPTPEQPLIVRSSAIGEDSESTSAAGQYESIAQVTSREALAQAITQCQASYNRPTAVQYRRDRGIRDEAMTVLVQVQVSGVFSGVAFSRDPISRQGDSVVIEALPGSAARVVSGQVTPESYQVMVTEADLTTTQAVANPPWRLPEAIAFPMEGEGDVPPRLIQQVAYLARHLEARYYGIPQDIEWSYDGQQLWVLQSRPITTILPIWTRKIAAEVIPGWIRPLTWSINRPLTCGVWGEIFTIVLGDRARGLDFTETATLHHSSAYFNASLLGQIFRRMGLPPESLEFLTRGTPFSKPPILSTLKNVPGLLKLLGRELRLAQDFEQDDQDLFTPGLRQLIAHPAKGQQPSAILGRIQLISTLLRRATYYSIMAPLSVALRQAMLKVSDDDLNVQTQPEIASLRSLQRLAQSCRPLVGAIARAQVPDSGSALFASLSETTDGQAVLTQFNQFLNEYGYLSQVATDIAVPRWREAPQPVRELFLQYLNQPIQITSPPPETQSWRSQQVQARLTLKGRVTEVYNRLLAELRWSYVAIELHWLASGLLTDPGDIFFLTDEEIHRLLNEPEGDLAATLSTRISERRSQFQQDQTTPAVPWLVYGNEPPRGQRSLQVSASSLRGIAASPGYVEGTVKILRTLQPGMAIDSTTILVVPYTDAGWSPVLARAGGLIAEVGGRLSHGAILAREYGIPAVMNVQNAMQWLRDGQRVRLDGEAGTVEVITDA
ncbi:MAG: glycerol-3-phosphate acyltransferase [Elainellaceae cyanobacterium]